VLTSTPSPRAISSGRNAGRVRPPQSTGDVLSPSSRGRLTKLPAGRRCPAFLLQNQVYLNHGRARQQLVANASTCASRRRASAVADQDARRRALPRRCASSPRRPRSRRSRDRSSLVAPFGDELTPMLTARRHTRELARKHSIRPARLTAKPYHDPGGRGGTGTRSGPGQTTTSPPKARRRLPGHPHVAAGAVLEPVEKWCHEPAAPGLCLDLPLPAPAVRCP